MFGLKKILFFAIIFCAITKNYCAQQLKYPIKKYIAGKDWVMLTELIKNGIDNPKTSINDKVEILYALNILYNVNDAEDDFRAFSLINFLKLINENKNNIKFVNAIKQHPQKKIITQNILFNEGIAQYNLALLNNDKLIFKEAYNYFSFASEFQNFLVVNNILPTKNEFIYINQLKAAINSENKIDVFNTGRLIIDKNELTKKYIKDSYPLMVYFLNANIEHGKFKNYHNYCTRLYGKQFSLDTILIKRNAIEGNLEDVFKNLMLLKNKPPFQFSALNVVTAWKNAEKINLTSAQLNQLKTLVKNVNELSDNDVKELLQDILVNNRSYISFIKSKTL